MTSLPFLLILGTKKLYKQPNNVNKAILIMRQVLNLIIIAALLLQVQNLTTYYHQTISGSANYQALTFSIASGFNVLAIQFEVTNLPLSNLLAFASLSPIPTNYTLIDISTLIPSKNMQIFFDLKSAVGGNTQIINMRISNSSTNMIYLTIYNFDLPEIASDKTYSITFHHLSEGVFCQTCPAGTSLSNSAIFLLQCQCQSCPLNYIGSACQYQQLTLLSGQSASKDFIGIANAYFLIEDKKQNIALKVQEVTSTNQVKLYIQYEDFDGQLAGKLNCYDRNNRLPLDILVTHIPTTVNIPTLGRSVHLTFSSRGHSVSSVAFVFIYNPDKQSNFLTIILASCFGGMGFILAIIAICYLYRYLRVKNMAIFNQSSTIFTRRIEASQMGIFSPEISASSFYSKKNPLQKQVQCSVCFEQIKLAQMVRITYCKHAFHSDCLQKWFQDTQKCPDCNQIFDQRLSARINNQKYEEKSTLGETFAKEFWKKQHQTNISQMAKKSHVVQQKSMEILKVEDIQSEDATES